MTSHGVPRVTNLEPRSEAVVQRELEQIEKYRNDVKDLQKKVAEQNFSEQTFDLCSQILSLNPEYYTIWNHRRRVLSGQWAATSEPKEGITSRIASELKFLTSLMLKYPKCYWIWNYRLWILDQASELLSGTDARSFWETELALVGKMLSRDGRNFHGWRYRRMVVAVLESEGLSPDGKATSLARQEFDYTTEMIRMNLSNFSAWHNRSKLIPRILEEEHSDDGERQAFLDQELELIHEALIDPYDQSLWFYHACLIASFDPAQTSRAIAPALTEQQRLKYLECEVAYVSEMLEDMDDCKWVFQTLIELARLYKRQGGVWPPGYEQSDIFKWMERLQNLDPLRTARWVDLKAEIGE